MSRIHEALLKSQREQDLHNGGLTGGKLAPKDLEDPVSHNSFGIDSTAAIAEESSVPTAVADAPRSFAQHSWRPDKERLVFMKPEFSRGIEEFRMLRSRLLRERTHRHLKTVLITGAGPGEGKTFIAANLALAMSRHPRSRVLVIDADLRRSNLHTIFGMEAVPGLSGYLEGKVEASAIVRQTPEPKLCVITAGRYCDTPTEMLHSPRMQELIQNMGLCFDWILVDSPPATAVTDSSVLSELCDAVVLVMAPGTPINLAQKSRKEMGQKVLGVVLNRAEFHADYYSYYNNYQQKGIKQQSPQLAKLRSHKVGKR